MLSSWKEIAHFFGKGVRTVQRWEKTLDLPIHRPPGAPSNVVLARTSDLEEWMHRGSVVRAVQAESAEDTASPAILLSVSALEAEVASLAVWIGVPLPEAKSASVEDRVAAAVRLIVEIRGTLSDTLGIRAA